MTRRTLYYLIILCNALFANQTIGTLYDLYGNVFLSNSVLNKTLELEIDSDVSSGDIIRTSNLSGCTIFFNNNKIQLNLDADSEIKIVENNLSTNIYINYGSVYIQSNKNLKNDLMVFSLASQIQMNNAIIWMRMNNKGGDIIHTIDGEISVFNGNKKETLTSKKNKAIISYKDGFFPKD